jgi:amino acid transporter
MGAINIGTAFFFQGTFGSLIGMTTDPVHIVLFVVAITAGQAVINHLGIKLTALLTDWSGYLILATTVVLVIALLVLAPTHDWSRLWTFTNNSGDAGGGVFPQSDNMLYLFSLCLLLPIYTITGYDASAHTSEETKNAAVSVPKGIVNSVIISSLVGWVMVSAIMIAIPDLAVGAKQGWSVFFATMTAVLPGWLVTLIYLGILIAQLLCGLATVTSTSRMLFAFSRDGGLPFVSKAVSSVSLRFRTPVVAIWTGAILEMAFVWLAQTQSIGGTNIYTLTVNATLIFLFLSFTVPIVAGFFAIGTAKWPAMGPWSLGVGVYKVLAVLSVLAMALIIYIAVQPPNGQVLWITLAFLVVAAIIWFAFENRRFQGPPVGDVIKKKQAEIAATEAKFGEA